MHQLAGESPVCLVSGRMISVSNQIAAMMRWGAAGVFVRQLPLRMDSAIECHMMDTDCIDSKVNNQITNGAIIRQKKLYSELSITRIPITRISS